MTIAEVAAVVRRAVDALPVAAVSEAVQVTEELAAVLAATLSGAGNSDARAAPGELAVALEEMRAARSALARAEACCQDYLPVLEGR